MKMGNTNISVYELEKYLPLKKMEVPLVRKTIFSYNAVVNIGELKGSTIDYIEQTKYNKDLGYLGEEFVFKYEKECVKKYKLPDTKQVRWISRDEGDGLGYDILSFDSQGNEIYIEVKTTQGEASSTLYITANELLRSEKEKEKFFLYRVYNFDTNKKQGEISVRRGSLKELCIMPQIYKVEFSKI